MHSAAIAERPRFATILVSIDGFRAVDLVQCDELGLAIPTLRRLMSEGTVAEELISIFPSLTYPAHVSLVTGTGPDRHGVLNNEMFSPDSEAPAPWFFEARLIRDQTLWNAFRRAGASIGAVGWPVTVGAPIDWNLPELWEPGDFEGTFIRKSVAASTPGLVEGAERRFGFRFSLERLDEHRNFVARHLLLEHRPDLLLLHYNELDKKQHVDGPGSRSALSAMEKLDRLLGELLETAHEAWPDRPPLVCVVSDHGFEEIGRQFNPNAVLRRAGLIEYGEPPETVKRWRARAWAAGGAAAVVLHDRGDSEALAQARQALAPYTTGTDAPLRAILRPEEAGTPAGDSGAAFMLDAAPGWMIGSRGTGEVVEAARVKGMHGQHPDRPGMAGIFILAGPGVPRGLQLGKTRLIDVAPTLAQLAGVALPNATGRALSLTTSAPAPR